MSAFSPVVTVDNPPRGSGSQTPGSFPVQVMRGTRSWGSAPAAAMLQYLGAAPVTAGAWCAIQMGALRFCGICRADTALAGSGGATRTLEFVDLRDFLTWDWVFGAFNKVDVQLVNGERRKRYWHIYPDDYETLTKTYTNAPLLAHQILTAIFTAPTIGSPWSWDLTSWGQFPAGLMNEPVYELDCLNGRRLDALLSEISERAGLVFTLDSSDPDFPYRLVWTRKGYGTLPAFPSNSDERRLGVALSGHATNIRVLGDRNRYQVLNLTMDPDWATGWEQFLVPDEFVFDIYNNELNGSGVAYNAYAGDTDHWAGYNDAKVRALEITVGDYVALREARSAGSGAVFVDQRKFAGRWRMDMPAMLYIETILRRAFRPQTGTITNIEGNAIPLDSLALSDRQLCRVFLDYATGVMTQDAAAPVDGNGVLAVKGYQAGEDLFRLAHPDRIDASFFNASARGWGTVPFQIDDSGEGVRFIIAESPVFVSSTTAGKELLKVVDGKIVLNAAFELATPSAKAALVFEGERYSYWKGTYPNVSRDHVENVPGLVGEYSGNNGSYTEVLYADGESADEKGEAIADTLLLRQYFYYTGGYVQKWLPNTPLSGFGTALSSLRDRSDIECGPHGVVERCDWTSERLRDHFEPERDLDRKTQQSGLFPGQAELRRETEDVKRFGAGLRQLQKTGAMALFQKFLRGEPISGGSMQQVWITGGSGTLAAGTPLTTDNTTKRVKPPGSLATTDAFVGVTVRQDEDATRPLQVQTGGRALVRVQGPVAIGDMVGLVAGQSYLNKASTASVGKAQEAIGDSSTKLIWVQLGAGGGGGGTEYQCFNIKTVNDDYLICRTWNGSSEGSVDVNVAKDWQFRKTLTSEVIDTVTYTYTWATSNQRTSSDGTNSQVEVVYPRYSVYSTPGANQVPPGRIFAIKAAYTGVIVSSVQLEWIEVKPSRVWAKKYA